MIDRKIILMMAAFLTALTYFSYCLTKLIRALLEVSIEVIGN